MNKKCMSYGISIKGVISACLLGLFWAAMPVFGWSEYSLEGAMISCSIEWNKKTTTVISYTMCMGIFVYLIPVFLLVFTNTRIFLIVSNSIVKVYICFKYLDESIK
jgi:hypothetical protein